MEIKTITDKALGIAKHRRDALGIAKKHWARHWGLKTDNDRILAIGRCLGEGLMKTLSRKKKSDLKLEM